MVGLRNAKMYAAIKAEVHHQARRQREARVESAFGKKIMEAELTRRQRQLLELVKRAGPEGYEVSGFGHPDASTLYRAGLVEMGRNERGITVLKITAKGQGESSAQEAVSKMKHFSSWEIARSGSLRNILTKALKAGKVRRDDVVWRGPDGSVAVGADAADLDDEYTDFTASGSVDEYID